MFCKGCWLCTLMLCLFTVMPAQAHHLWVEGSGEDFRVRRGLIPDRIDEYAPENLAEVRAFDASGGEIDIQRIDHAEGVRLRISEEPALVVVTCDWGDRVNTPDGKKILSRREALAQNIEVLSAFTSTQYAKTFFSSGDIWTRPAGLPLEIIPLARLETLAPDEKLPLKLLFNNQPLADVSVRSSMDKADIRTDSEGIFEVVLQGSGLQTIYASHSEPTAHSRDDIDYRQYMTFIVFNLP